MISPGPRCTHRALTLRTPEGEIGARLQPTDMPSVAFLGLGAIGRPMAARLAHAPGVTLTIWNRSADKARTFAREHGARAAATPAEAAAGAEVVITCFPVSSDVESVLEGPDG